MTGAVTGPAAAGRRGGLVVRTDGGLAFLPAASVVRIEPAPRITPVPGAPAALLGIALLGGVVVPVIGIGSEATEVILCSHAGEWIGLGGGRVVASGLFGVVAHRPGAVDYEGQVVAPLDLHALYASAEHAPRTAGLSLT
jgi:hypothetical protein